MGESAQRQQETLERRSGMAWSPGGRGHNEDSGAVTDYSDRTAGSYLCFMAVADGMGGHRAGDVASRTAVEMLESMLDPETFEGPEAFAERAEEALLSAFQAVNGHIYELGRASDERKGMGTTLTCALVNEESAFIAHVGDTRAYLVAPGSTRQLTQDHSVVGKLVAEGVLTEQQALAHEQRNVITRAVGPEPSVEVDVLRVPVREGESLVMCTDGLYTRVSAEEIALAVSGGPDLQAACENLVGTAVRRSADDNVTAVAWRMPVGARAPGRPRAGGRVRGRLWGAVLLALLVTALGFGIGWGVGSVWYAGNAPAQDPDAGIVEVFMSGDVVRVRLEDAGGVALKDSPDGATVASLEDGWELEVVSGPRTSGGQRWYEVEVTDARFAGPVGRGFVAAARIEPI